MQPFPTRKELVDRISTGLRDCPADVYIAVRRELDFASIDALRRIAGGTWKIYPEPRIEVIP